MKIFLAHIIIEAQTPLKVGCGDSNFFEYSLVQKDWNGLPMILGTSLNGILREAFKGNNDVKNDIFGTQDEIDTDKQRGSKLIISNALLLDENDKVCEDLLNQRSEFLKLFDNLPIREHTAITKLGSAKDKSKFSEEIVFKGSRFKFSLELTKSDEETFIKLLNTLSKENLRVGSGSTKGFGKFKIQNIFYENLELFNYTSSLNKEIELKKFIAENKDDDISYRKYEINLIPDDFYIFGSGFGDDESDSTPVYEYSIDYVNKKLSKKQILIPASSVKGAISHRTTFHLNKLKSHYINDIEAVESVEAIFGSAENKKKSKGKILISDCFIEDNDETKIFNHICIDRFTGGTIDGALFQEKVIADKNEISIEILLDKSIDGDELKAFKNALIDVAKGLLPLGGYTTKGHGFFSGTILEDNKTMELKYETK